ncbi:MAG TPA: glycosyltransferase family 2 protein [Ktedonobacterales bacterium]|nr:glycosyltransferase family 2 protein [Ktedonobacterales bacterium]
MRSQVASTRKREWGTEQRTIPLPSIHTRPSTRTIAFGRLGIVATVLLWALYVFTTIFRQFFDWPHTASFTLQAASYLVVVTFLTFSALVYLLLRQGAIERFGKHVRVPRAELNHCFAERQPSITVLVPSYAEEPAVIRKTLLSAALQEYPDLRIVLLIDDNPDLTNAAASARLAATRRLTNDLMQWLAEPQERFIDALRAYEQHRQQAVDAPNGPVKHLAEEYAWAANWLVEKANEETIDDHVDTFFADQVFRELAKDLRLISQALVASYEQGAQLPEERVLQLYRRLAWTFSAELAAFERKHYVSLSHEPNKAMNLNSYIGLMGGSYRSVATPEGLALVRAEQARPGDITIPDSDYLLTLDADSILLREYCLRLVYCQEQPGNERVAVTQTPYSSFRGAPTRLERLAAATTDVQHILQQGMTSYGATFWVGANAVIRKKALEDIVEKEYIGGFEIKRYIQSRTVIEDTESSIDLALNGWSLMNYSERLSYSATPPDFGSLVIQRRRWANGGLLILPKLWAQVRERRRRGQAVSTAEYWLRLNYMGSTAWSTFGLIFLLAFPYDGRLLSPFVVLAALPYFLAMASDLHYCGYKRSDVLRIYGFNLILLPVNLAGVLKSLQQALTGRRSPFVRTPKIKDRTVTPLLYLFAPLSIVAFSVFTLWRDYSLHNWANAAFAAFNAIVTCWAIFAYIGIDHMLVDMWLGLTNWFYVTTYPKQPAPVATSEPVLDWQAVLYHGHSREMVPLSVIGTQSASSALTATANER